MRFKTNIRNVSTFSKLAQSFSAIGKVAWLRLSENEVRFVLHAPEGTQVWALKGVGIGETSTLFDAYQINSAANNVINLEVPLAPLHRALRSCSTGATSATLRLTKRSSDNAPVLCITINTSVISTVLITQEIPVRVLSVASVESIQEPRVPAADVHIYLPSPVSGVRAIVDRLNRLGRDPFTSPKITVAANRDGEFKMSVHGSEVRVETCWRDLQNPRLVAEDDEEEQPTAATAETERERGRWAEVRVDGREWEKVLRVGTLARRVVVCICEGVALIVYVFLTDEEQEDQTVLTYYMNSYST